MHHSSQLLVDMHGVYLLPHHSTEPSRPTYRQNHHSYLLHQYLEARYQRSGNDLSEQQQQHSFAYYLPTTLPQRPFSVVEDSESAGLTMHTADDNAMSLNRLQSLQQSSWNQQRIMAIPSTDSTGSTAFTSRLDNDISSTKFSTNTDPSAHGAISVTAAAATTTTTAMPNLDASLSTYSMPHQLEQQQPEARPYHPNQFNSYPVQQQQQQQQPPDNYMVAADSDGYRYTDDTTTAPRTWTGISPPTAINTTPNTTTTVPAAALSSSSGSVPSPPPSSSPPVETETSPPRSTSTSSSSDTISRRFSYSMGCPSFSMLLANVRNSELKCRELTKSREIQIERDGSESGGELLSPTPRETLERRRGNDSHDIFGDFRIRIDDDGRDNIRDDNHHSDIGNDHQGEKGNDNRDGDLMHPQQQTAASALGQQAEQLDLRCPGDDIASNDDKNTLPWASTTVENIPPTPTPTSATVGNPFHFESITVSTMMHRVSDSMALDDEKNYPCQQKHSYRVSLREGPRLGQRQGQTGLFQLQATNQSLLMNPQLVEQQQQHLLQYTLATAAAGTAQCSGPQHHIDSRRPSFSDSDTDMTTGSAVEFEGISAFPFTTQAQDSSAIAAAAGASASVGAGREGNIDNLTNDFYTYIPGLVSSNASSNVYDVNAYPPAAERYAVGQGSSYLPRGFASNTPSLITNDSTHTHGMYAPAAFPDTLPNGNTLQIYTGDTDNLPPSLSSPELCSPFQEHPQFAFPSSTTAASSLDMEIKNEFMYHSDSPPLPQRKYSWSQGEGDLVEEGEQEDPTPVGIKQVKSKRASKPKSKRKPASVSTRATDEFFCDHPGCNKTFPKAHSLKSHQKCHAPRTFNCPHCPSTFRRNHDLRRHVRSLHCSEEGKPHGCRFCGKRFARSDAMRRHLKRGCSSGPALLKASASTRVQEDQDEEVENDFDLFPSEDDESNGQLDSAIYPPVSSSPLSPAKTLLLPPTTSSETFLSSPYPSYESYTTDPMTATTLYTYSKQLQDQVGALYS